MFHQTKVAFIVNLHVVTPDCAAFPHVLHIHINIYRESIRSILAYLIDDAWFLTRILLHLFLFCGKINICLWLSQHGIAVQL